MRFSAGQEVWFIGQHGRWYRCKLVEHNRRVTVLRSLTGFDAERQVPWPYPEELAFSSYQSVLYRRLRPASARSLQ